MTPPRPAALLVVAAGLAACGSRTPEPAPTVTAAAAPVANAAPEPVLALAPLTISFEGQPIARLHADGRSEAVGDNPPGGAMVPGPTMHADGSIELRGGVTARVERDGAIVVVQPGSPPTEHRFGQVVGDELRVTGSSKPWDVRIQGDQLEFSNGVPPNQLAGATTPGLRRTALALTAAYFIDLAVTSTITH